LIVIANPGEPLGNRCQRLGFIPRVGGVPRGLARLVEDLGRLVDPPSRAQSEGKRDKCRRLFMMVRWT